MTSGSLPLEIRSVEGVSSPGIRRGLPAVVAVALLLAGSLAAAPARAQVAEETFAPSTAGAVTIFDSAADGDVEPVRRIVGGNTGLGASYALAVDGVHQEIVVANFSPASVTAHEIGDDGDEPPTRTLAGASTLLGAPIAVAVDPIHDELFVLSYSSPVVRVYPRTAIGDTAPIRSLAGEATGIVDSSRELTLDLVHGELIVASSNGKGDGSVRVFPRTADGDVAPLRVIAGPTAGLVCEIAGVEVDTVHDEIVAACGASIKVFARTADGDVAPLRTIAGAATGLEYGAAGLALDLRRDELVVAQQGYNRLLVFARTADGNAAPLRAIVGAQTQLSGPTRIDVVPALLFADGFGDGDACLWSSAVGGGCF